MLRIGDRTSPTAPLRPHLSDRTSPTHLSDLWRANSIIWDPVRRMTLSDLGTPPAAPSFTFGWMAD